MLAKARAMQGKQDFVRKRLSRNPAENEKSINDAWREAGNEGTISGSLFYVTKAKMGLTGKGRSPGAPKSSTQPEQTAGLTPPKRKVGRPPRILPKDDGASSSPPGLDGPRSLSAATDRTRALEELEADFDRLMAKVMSFGGTQDVEEALRRARRLLVLGNPG
jgi:hypothetical protein